MTPRTSEDPPGQGNGPSWAMMLALIGVAILVALGIAWAIIAPVLRHG